MTPRLPFLLLVTVVGAAAYTGSGGLTEGARPALITAPQPVAGLTAPAAPPGRSPGSTWYCAGGEAVVLANPTDDEVTGQLTVYPGELAPPPGDAGPATASSSTPPTAPTASSASAVPPVEQRFTLPAHDRQRFELVHLLPSVAPGEPAGVPTHRAAVVELDGGGVAVEQEIGSAPAGDVTPCASATSPEWHFAWGQTTRDARELLVLFNPFRGDASVDASFAIDGGVREPLRWQGLVVPARRAVVVDVSQDVTRRPQVAATVRSRGGGLVVSRVQSFDGSGGLSGSSLALGQPQPAATWRFAYGEVGDQAGERIVLYNPGNETADVDVEVGGAQPFGVVVRPGRFEVVDYGMEDRVPRQVAHTTLVRSRNGVPVVAERVLGPGQNVGRSGAKVVAGPGTPAPRPAWVLSAMPSTGVDDADQTHVAVANLDDRRPARVWVTVEQAGARSQPEGLQAVEIAPGGRTDLLLPPAAGTVAVAVHSDAPVVVERVVRHDGRVVSAAPALPVR